MTEPFVSDGDVFGVPLEIDPYAPGQQWAGRGGAARMRLLIVGTEGPSMRVVRTCGAPPHTLWAPFTVARDQLDAAFEHSPRGKAYAALDPAEYGVVRRFVACEGAMEPEGYPDQYVEAMADEFEKLADRLASRLVDLYHDAGDEPPDLARDQWRRIALACMLDDGHEAIDFITPEVRGAMGWAP
jgi:hypothetical protein